MMKWKGGRSRIGCCGWVVSLLWWRGEEEDEEAGEWLVWVGLLLLFFWVGVSEKRDEGDYDGVDTPF